MESGQVIPLHIASADNMADFGTVLMMMIAFIMTLGEIM